MEDLGHQDSQGRCGKSCLTSALKGMLERGQSIRISGCGVPPHPLFLMRTLSVATSSSAVATEGFWDTMPQ